MKTRAPAITHLLERPAVERKLGPFLLVEERGEGGYAPVWLAREMFGGTELRLAAVKLFALDDIASDKQRIIEEARALGLVNHPHVARFYALTIDESLGVVGLAMELLGGRSLEDRLRIERTLRVEDALGVGVAIASALAEVHRAGIVHRDVKPSNIVEDDRGICKLIDFGIATPSDDASCEFVEIRCGRVTLGQTPSDSTVRLTGAATGTPGYVDPACASGRARASASSDLYALGATLYRCLSGDLPAQITSAGSGDRLLDPRVLSGEISPEPLASRAANIPPALAVLVDRLLSPRPENRPRGALQVERELERIRLELGGRTRDLPSEDEGPFRGLRQFETRHRGVFWDRRNAITMVAGLFIAVLLAAGAWMIQAEREYGRTNDDIVRNNADNADTLEQLLMDAPVGRKMDRPRPTKREEPPPKATQATGIAAPVPTRQRPAVHRPPSERPVPSPAFSAMTEPSPSVLPSAPSMIDAGVTLPASQPTQENSATVRRGEPPERY